MDSLADVFMVSQLNLLDTAGTPRSAGGSQGAENRSNMSQIYRAPGPPIERSASQVQVLRMESGLKVAEGDGEEFEEGVENEGNRLVQDDLHGSSETVGEKPILDPPVHILKTGSLSPLEKPSFFKANLGLLWMLLAACLFTVMSISVKAMTVASERLPTLEIVFFRSVLVWIMGVACMLYWEVENPIFGPKGVRQLLLLRSVVGFAGLVCGWSALSMLTLADATVLGFLSPVFTAILARVVLKEPYGPIDAVTGALSMLGVLVIARPPFIFGAAASDATPDDLLASGTGSGFGAEGVASEVQLSEETMTTAAQVSATGASTQFLGVLIGLAGAVLGATIFIIVRRLAGRATPLHIVSVFSLVSIPLSIFAALVPTGGTNKAWIVPQDPLTYMFLLLVSASAYGGQLCVTKSLELESAGKASSMNYVQVIVAFLAEWIIWGQPPSMSSIIGGSIVGSSIVIITVHKLRGAK
ncbi:hypothetical protein PhCBS80983_g04980 [Powellomyces hirtus]|uniref:EamA domain-containing protein n=1 Tax=Powellomyces hirtus TaxID=109895 RepID=A0A507DXF3_9FUNG|nr:hypothetical protein PhCBS80983_g04980 [Powellomyces hirtus]